MPSFLRSLALGATLFSSLSLAVRPVEIRGQDFVDTVTGKRLMIIGVDYQPGGQAGYKPQERSDALTDADVCLRDAALLQSLGANTIRVYNVDPTLNHDECASIFNAAGIYMIIDVNSPFGGESINRAEPEGSYHVGYLGRIFGVVENFKNYPNTLAFFAANEVMNDVPSSKDNPPFIRAVQRDLKNYIAKHADRTIPVGYSAADVRPILEDTWAYYQCALDGDQDDKSRSDFFGLNSYSWCGGDATFETAGYDVITEMFKNSSIPVFFSEYGCNEVQPRVFNEVSALYGEEMTALSGGLIYEYSQEESDYGLVTINDNGTVSLMTDFANLQEQYNKVDISLIQSTDPSSTSIKAPKCDSKLISDSGFSKDFDIPEPPEGAEDLINNGVDDGYVRGKLVPVTATKVTQKIYGTNGNEITGVELKKVQNDDSNVPSGQVLNSGEGGSNEDGGQPAEPTKKGAASTLTVSGGALFAVFAMVAMFL
ncbi:glycoside hydrolase family 72 protein [Sporormia fimetaria CBS 119925]|uniref:1,3-beta-glucanosyltransferase n=1 Tax=Sporormia fimetaria CBS 119925 TaxID=1340428 RepID=A0A6A6V308_9PLEO|nr:glycoside hydrolase family 72 protein [Sporormia fimetaria CBS 119925]